MSAPTVTVVAAAAGCGKTTELARRYLGFLADGVPVEQAVAITFTRKAAAELRERVTLALRACLPGPSAERAQQRLGAAWPVYADAAPSDPAVVRAALEGLSDAPIGTTDSFIQSLLTELALEAALPLPDGAPVPLDLPLRATGSVRPALQRAARRLVDPPHGQQDPDVVLLLRHLTLGEIITRVSHRTPYDHLPLARAEDVLAVLARAGAEVLARHELSDVLQVSGSSLEEWMDACDRRTNQAAKWAVRSVTPWLYAGGPVDEAPHQLPAWLRGLDQRSKARKAVRADLQRTPIDLGPTPIDLWSALDILAPPFEPPDRVEHVDLLRDALERLRARVVATGLASAAEAGELGHDELAEAAIALCEAAPARLHGRFRALLVDEVQDANPTQMRLYRALMALPGPAPIRACFVGDARQSIYLFRQAEPAGFRELARMAGADDGELARLWVNYRSSPALVAAHQRLFAALQQPLADRGIDPLDPLDDLEAEPSNRALTPDPHPDPAPVWLVRGGPDEKLKYRDADHRALDGFYERVLACWEARPDTAAVLAPTWASAREAATLLRRWAGRDDVAFVEGGASDADSAVPTDLRMLLRALLDPTDDVAWLGTWKHPGAGLTDAALARVRQGAGVPRPTGLGYLVDVDALQPPHGDGDREAFARAAPVLRAARDALGRQGTASVLDEVVSALGWRSIYAAGPGGVDDVACLDVLLDQIRELDGDGVDPHRVLTTLADPDAVDAPQIHADRPDRYIACTTVFQAKGLAWDHVLVVSPGRPPRPFSGDDPEPTWIALSDGTRRRLAGVKVDPDGGLVSITDPLGRLAGKIHRRRSAEECVRLAYVALTRARRSVTVGIPDDPARCDEVQELIARAWGALAPDEGLSVVRRDDRATPPPLPTGWVAARPRVALQRPPALPPARFERAPSSAAAYLPPAARQQQAEWVAHHVRLNNGLHLGDAPVDPPHRAHVDAATWGQLAHGWFAAWRFQGPVELDAVRAWLAAEWRSTDLGVAGWLTKVSTRLASRGGPLWDLVTAPDATLHFELPFVGAGRAAGQDLVLSGRVDLLVEQRRALTLVDFKAGGRAPTGASDLIDGASLRTYGPQLEAYRSALAAAGRPVDQVALWFVRTGTSVRW